MVIFNGCRMVKMHQLDTISPEQFKDHIVGLYRSLEYEVGTLIDQPSCKSAFTLSCSLPGAGRIDQLVYCCPNTKEIGIEKAIKQCLSLLKDLGLGQGIIVFGNKLDKKAASIARKHKNIVLMKLSDLTSQSEWRGEYLDLIREYESSDIYEAYVSQRSHGRLPHLASGSDVEDSAESLFRWSSSGRTGTCFVLGDYGTGKTTLLNRIHYLHLKALSNGESVPRPILFYLKNFYKFDQMDDYIIQTYKENYRTNIDTNKFRQLVDSGKFLILLDGFDEVAIESNERIRQLYINRLSPLLFTSSPTMVSCRPSYFIDSNELSQWSRGEYPHAMNAELDIGILTASLGRRGDDYVGIHNLGSTSSIEVEGHIEHSADVDTFSFRVDSPQTRVTLDIQPWHNGPNLDVGVSLLGESGNRILGLHDTNVNPTDRLASHIDIWLEPGTYYLNVEGVGKAATHDDPGYSDYGSLGYYRVRGELAFFDPRSDLDGDGDVDFADFLILSHNFGDCVECKNEDDFNALVRSYGYGT